MENKDIRIQRVADKGFYISMLKKVNEDEKLKDKLKASAEDVSRLIKENADDIAMQLCMFKAHTLVLKDNKVVGIFPYDTYIHTGK